MMISSKSLKNLKLIIDTSQLFAFWGIHFFPFQWDPSNNRVRLIPKLRNWSVMAIINILYLLGYMLAGLISFLFCTSQDIISLTILVWGLATMTCVLTCEVHLYVHCIEVCQWINSCLYMNLKLSKLKSSNFRKIARQRRSYHILELPII